MHEDIGEVIGLSSEAVSDYLEKIPIIIHDSVFPMIIPEIYTTIISGKIVLVIQVYPGNKCRCYHFGKHVECECKMRPFSRRVH